MSSFKPMLAERESAHLWHPQIRFPVYASPKLDGYRCCIVDGKAVTRSLKPIANEYIRAVLSAPDLNGFDGELLVFPDGEEIPAISTLSCMMDAAIFNRTSSGVSKKSGEPNFVFVVFDDFSDPSLSYLQRMDNVRKRIWPGMERFHVQCLHAYQYNNWEAVEGMETAALNMGYEGLILRSPLEVYKHGRSTAREQGMLKLKRFVDGEAEIIGFEELMRNENEAFTNELGNTKRSTSADGLVPGGTLGAFIARDLATGVEFNIGMFKGLTSSDKQKIWDNRANHLGRISKYMHFPSGAKDKPRHAKHIGFRDLADL